MQTTNQLITKPVTAETSFCHSAGGSSGSLFRRRRGLIVGGVFVVASVALALGQGWIALASLTPLLFLLPCALMMFMCMKGHGGPTGTTRAPSITDKPTGPGTAPG